MIDQPLAPLDIVLRILAALAAGFVVGFERESRGRAAGLRTTVLVCVSACLIMIGAHLLYVEADVTLGGTSWRPDPTRVVQGILSGMGFLGAGTILRQGTIIRGLTTAAGLWLVTILGILFGSGYYLVGAIGVLVALLTLLLLTQFEKLIENERYVIVAVTLSLDGSKPQALRQHLESAGAKVLRTDLNYDLPHKTVTVTCELRFRTRHYLEFSQSIVDGLLRQKGVQQLKWDLQN